MIAEGKIVIELDRNPTGGDLDVRIDSNRISNIGKVFKGRTPNETLALLPMIFSLCGKAHLCVANNVIRSYGMETGISDIAGQLAVLAENAREHLLRVILGWSRDNPETIKQLPVKHVMSLVADMDTATNSTDVMAVKDISNRLEGMLGDHIFGYGTEQWLQMESLGDLENWIASTDTIASRYLGKIVEHNWQSVGAVDVEFLPKLSFAELREKMHSGDVDRFIGQPDWRGQCFETGPLARWHEHPLVASIIKQHGSGLLTRTVARLIELAGIPVAIRALVATSDLSNRPADKRDQTKDGIVGIADVETARGRLVHSMKLRDGVIADYRILAPTEWNFHPRGSAAKGLGSLAFESDEDLQRGASMLIEAIDPCVDFEVRIV